MVGGPFSKENSTRLESRAQRDFQQIYVVSREWYNINPKGLDGILYVQLCNYCYLYL